MNHVDKLMLVKIRYTTNKIL